MLTRISFLLCLLFFYSTGYLLAQGEKDLLKELMKEDRSAVDAIVMYPEEVRNNIFELSLHPEILIKLSGLQEKTQKNFRNYIANYPQEEQAKFYELSRYPGLIKDLAGEGKQSKSEIGLILPKYPEEVHETALELGRKEYDTLHKIFRLNQATKQAFDNIIKPYPSNVQIATRELVKMPEVLSILIENINTTILVGDVYQKDPAWIQSKAKELNLEVARQQAVELEDYKKQLEEDPEAYQEMLDAAELYAEENHVKESEKKKESTSSVQVVYSYPYWYGYPYWYSYPYWSPVPYYYHTGFYMGPGGVVIIVGLPSYHYVSWHYAYYPHRHVHLHAHYHRHYRRHPHSRGGFHAAVNVNVNNRDRSPMNRSLPGNRQNLSGDKLNSSNMKIDKDKFKSKDLNRFRASDSHRGNWSKKRKRSK